MEYLVTMTTHVPDGTSEQEVDDVRAREAARSRQLAAEGSLLRLWRPPLQPGEWRSLALFAAADETALEKVLASMPLRIWRTDDVTALSPHADDPANGPDLERPSAQEFFTAFTTAVPADTPPDAFARAKAGEAQRAHELAGEGHLVRLWELPNPDQVLGLWRARDAAQMQAIVTSLPLDPYLTTQVTPLSQHPSDPPLATS